MLADVVTGELVKLPGVSRTQTMVAFEVFSRHDLEAMFSIGGLGRARAGGPAGPRVGRARLDHARGARRGDAHLPLHADRRRGPPRGVFDRFYSEVGVVEAGDLAARLAATSEHLNPEFGVLFDELLRRRVERLAVEPEDLVALVEAITIYHMVIEGMLALTGQHFIIDYNERMGTLPGFVDGFTKVARDEHRHVAFGARFLRDMARRDARYGEAIQRALVEVAPAADGVLRPSWVQPGDEDVVILGASVSETRAFALKALERPLKVIGLATAA